MTRVGTAKIRIVKLGKCKCGREDPLKDGKCTYCRKRESIEKTRSKLKLKLKRKRKYKCHPKSQS